MKENVETSLVMFDLGGVLYDIDLRRTKDSFGLLAGREIDFSLQSQHEVFSAFECGKITADEFRHGLRSAYGISATDEQMDSAWNALLVGLHEKSVDWVRSAKNKHRVVLLSNINELHHARIASECAELFQQFDCLYLSYQIGLRKPTREIFDYVLHHTGTAPEKILYFDDSPQHLDTASRLGIRCQQVHHIESMPTLMSAFF